jgi:hypothetical protein
MGSVPMGPLLFDMTQMSFAVYDVEASAHAGTADWIAAKPLVHASAALEYWGEYDIVMGGYGVVGIHCVMT